MDFTCLFRQYSFVRFEVFTAVTMKSAVFWDVALCRSYDILEGRIASIFREEEDGGDAFLRNITRSTWRHIPEDVTLQYSFVLRLRLHIIK
jgi:hypothetical protein